MESAISTLAVFSGICCLNMLILGSVGQRLSIVVCMPQCTPRVLLWDKKSRHGRRQSALTTRPSSFICPRPSKHARIWHTHVNKDVTTAHRAEAPWILHVSSAPTRHLSLQQLVCCPPLLLTSSPSSYLTPFFGPPYPTGVCFGTRSRGAGGASWATRTRRSSWATLVLRRMQHEHMTRSWWSCMGAQVSGVISDY